MDLLNRTIFKWASKVIPLQWRTLAKVWNEKEKQQSDVPFIYDKKTLKVF